MFLGCAAVSIIVHFIQISFTRFTSALHEING